MNNTTTSAKIFSDAQQSELLRLKSYFPFRIVWGAVSASGEFVSGASKDRRQLNKYAHNPQFTVAILN